MPCVGAYGNASSGSSLSIWPRIDCRNMGLPALVARPIVALIRFASFFASADCATIPLGK